MNIRRLTQSDTLSVNNIWRECFTRDQEYISNFIENCFPHTISLGLFDSKKQTAISMLSLLPCHIKNKNKLYKGLYVYGVGTLAEHRGNRYSDTLMEESFRYVKDNEYSFSVVKPAEESLFPQYKRQGFSANTESCRIEIDLIKFNGESRKHPGKSQASNSISSSELYKLRDQYLSNSHILFPEEIINYAHREAIDRGGICEQISTPNKIIYYCAYPNENHINSINIVDHNIMNPGDIRHVIQSIQNHYPKAKQAILETPISPCDLSTNLDYPHPFSFQKKKNSLISILEQSTTSPEKFMEHRILTLAME